MKSNLILIVMAIGLAGMAIANHGLLHDDDDTIIDLIQYLSGGEAADLDHEVEDVDHRDARNMESGLLDTAASLSDGNRGMEHKVDEIDALDLGNLIDANRRDDDDDDDGPHFEALSVTYGRKQQNMYDRGKPSRKSKGYSKPRSRQSGTGDDSQPDPASASPSPTGAPKPPSFDDFNNTKPQNDGNCLHALNKERQAAGVPELAHNQTLVELAAKHTAYMAASRALSHDGFWSYRFDAVPAGVIGVGEVVVADDLSNTPNGPAKRAVDRWMGSTEHRALLLRPDMFIMGCSTAQGSDGRFYATALVCSK